MNEKGKIPTRRTPSLATRDEQPLLRVLVFESTRRGETLAALARHLGVTYERLAQWRRNEGLLCNAHRDVHESAARYLGWPTVLVLAMAGTVGIQDFVWPGQGSLDMRVDRDLERLRQDPCLGGFVPADLVAAAPAVRLFVAFMFNQLTGEASEGTKNFNWIRAMHLAVAGNLEGQEELAALKRAVPLQSSIF